MPIPLPDTGTATSSEPALFIEQHGTGEGIVASHEGTGGIAVAGRAADDGVGVRGIGGRTGVHGTSETIGVLGEIDGTTGLGFGVAGNGGEDGIGVAGFGGSGVLGVGTGTGTGVAGGSPAGTGVHGRSVGGVGVAATSGSGPGVYATSEEGSGVYGRSAQAGGVVGEAAEAEQAGVFGYNPGMGGIGVIGLGGARASIGVFGEGQVGVVAQGNQTGMRARADNGPAVDARSETAAGVLGVSEGIDQPGVEGRAESNAGPNTSGVLGFAITGVGVRARSAAGVALDAESATGDTAHLRGSAGSVLRIYATEYAEAVNVTAAVDADTAVRIYSYEDQNALVIWGGNALMIGGNLYITDGNIIVSGAVNVQGNVDVFGRVVVTGDGADDAAITGLSLREGTAFGVRGEAMATPSDDYPIYFAAGIYGRALDAKSPGQWAGWFDGNVHVLGTLCKTSLCFQIDHPLRPKEQYLQHSTLESDDRRNFYDGTVTLDAEGTATVQLPEWFESINRSPRYQLTALGAPAPNLHVADELRRGCFRIAGGAAGQRVSWQVTAIRSDAWSRANPFEVEVDKVGGAKGRYLHPEVHGAAADEGLSPAVFSPAPKPQRPARPQPPERDDERPPREPRDAPSRTGNRVNVEPPQRPAPPRDFPDPKLRR